MHSFQAWLIIGDASGCVRFASCRVDQLDGRGFITILPDSNLPQCFFFLYSGFIILISLSFRKRELELCCWCWCCAAYLHIYNVFSEMFYHTILAMSPLRFSLALVVLLVYSSLVWCYFDLAEPRRFFTSIVISFSLPPFLCLLGTDRFGVWEVLNLLYFE